jgi:hypothetical protein
MLLARYVYPSKGKRARKERKDMVGEEIAIFVRNNAGPGFQFRTGVSAREIVRHGVPGTKPVAIAIPSRHGWTLIDGVDLNQSTAPAAISRADRCWFVWLSFLTLSKAHHWLDHLAVQFRIGRSAFTA